MIEKDTSRVRYLSPEEGVDYGIIDKVLYPEELRVQVRSAQLQTLHLLVLIVILHALSP
jgi:Clp protease